MSVVAALTLVSSAVFAGGNSIKQRLKLQQHQTFLQNQQNTQKAAAAAQQDTGGFETASGPEGARLPTLEDQSNAERINADRQVEATLIYRNLRLVQKIPHAEAIAVLKKAGYPTDRIVTIP
jgi:hypothetical protein